VKLGILGGTFNPIHLGHLRVAEEIGEELKLTKVYLIPTGIPPHKEQYPIAEFPHRLEMTKLASKISSILDVWDIEGKRSGLSYSIETLKAFHNYFGSTLELFYNRDGCLHRYQDLEGISKSLRFCLICCNQ